MHILSYSRILKFLYDSFLEPIDRIVSVALITCQLMILALPLTDGGYWILIHTALTKKHVLVAPAFTIIMTYYTIDEPRGLLWVGSSRPI